MGNAWIQLTLPGTIWAFFGVIALLDTQTPQNFGGLSALAWWVVIIGAVLVVLRLLA